MQPTLFAMKSFIKGLEQKEINTINGKFPSAQLSQRDNCGKYELSSKKNKYNSEDWRVDIDEIVCNTYLADWRCFMKVKRSIRRIYWG